MTAAPRCCPSCGQALSIPEADFAPHYWSLECPHCQTSLELSIGTQLSAALLFLAVLAVLLVGAEGLARLAMLASGGRLLVPAIWISAPLLLVAALLLPWALRWFRFRFGKLVLRDSNLRLASRVVLGLLLILMFFLVWLAWFLGAWPTL